MIRYELFGFENSIPTQSLLPLLQPWYSSVQNSPSWSPFVYFYLLDFPVPRKIIHWDTTDRTQQCQCPRHDRPVGHLINGSRPTRANKNCNTQCCTEKRIRPGICTFLAKDRWILDCEDLHFWKHVSGKGSEDKGQSNTLGDSCQQMSLCKNERVGSSTVRY